MAMLTPHAVALARVLLVLPSRAGFADLVAARGLVMTRATLHASLPTLVPLTLLRHWGIILQVETWWTDSFTAAFARKRWQAFALPGACCREHLEGGKVRGIQAHPRIIVVITNSTPAAHADHSVVPCAFFTFASTVVMQFLAASALLTLNT